MIFVVEIIENVTCTTILKVHAFPAFIIFFVVIVIWCFDNPKAELGRDIMKPAVSVIGVISSKGSTEGSLFYPKRIASRTPKDNRPLSMTFFRFRGCHVIVKVSNPFCMQWLHKR